MNIGDEDFQKEASHIPMSHLMMESGKPIFQGSLWACIREIRNNEAEMTRMVEHSPFTIMPAPRHECLDKFAEVPLHTASWRIEREV